MKTIEYVVKVKTKSMSEFTEDWMNAGYDSIEDAREYKKEQVKEARGCGNKFRIIKRTTVEEVVR
jgi:hypothetical protein